MNWPRGLFTLWLIGSAIWLIGWTIFVRQTCTTMPNGDLWCRAEEHGLLIHLGPYSAWTQLQIYLLGFTLPLAVLIGGMLLSWLLARRRRLP